MRPACLMLAQGVYKVCCPAIVDQRIGVDRNDAERADAFLAPLAIQELEVDFIPVFGEFKNG